MQKITTVKWYDTDTTETVKLAAQFYGIAVLAEYATGMPDEIYVTIGGQEADVNRFLKDLDEGDVEPFESKRELSDEEYQFWLESELSKLGVKYSPSCNDADSI